MHYLCDLVMFTWLECSHIRLSIFLSGMLEGFHWWGIQLNWRDLTLSFQYCSDIICFPFVFGWYLVFLFILILFSFLLFFQWLFLSKIGEIHWLLILCLVFHLFNYSFASLLNQLMGLFNKVILSHLLVSRGFDEMSRPDR